MSMCDSALKNMLMGGFFEGCPKLSYMYCSLFRTYIVTFVKFKPYEYLRIKVMNDTIYEISLSKQKKKIIIDKVCISYSVTVPYSKENMNKRYPGQFIRIPNQENINFSGYKLYKFNNDKEDNSLLQEIIYFAQTLNQPYG